MCGTSAGDWHTTPSQPCSVWHERRKEREERDKNHNNEKDKGREMNNERTVRRYTEAVDRHKYRQLAWWAARRKLSNMLTDLKQSNVCLSYFSSSVRVCTWWMVWTLWSADPGWCCNIPDCRDRPERSLVRSPWQLVLNKTQTESIPSSSASPWQHNTFLKTINMSVVRIQRYV